ncbi:GlpM family protein [Mesorhizobium sp. M0621]|uniref:GlpM family protein n=1 Tax=Mesorhizobium sp. M0621 TaxID=2956974 RepID=UPI00333A24F1
MDIVWKGVVGGLMTALIVWASKRGNVLPGILPLAPTFAVIALLAVGARGEPGGFRDACLAGVKTIPAYLAFLGACWLFIDRVDYRLRHRYLVGCCAGNLPRASLSLMRQAVEETELLQSGLERL